MRKPTPGPGWSMPLLTATLGMLLLRTPAGAAAGPAAARRGGQPRLSIASPATGNLVGGLVPVAVAFDAGAANRVTLMELWVDDLLYTSQPVDLADARGTVSLDWDTTRLRNGQHSVKVRAFSGHKLLASDSALVTVSNGGVDVVPPLVSFYTPLDGQTVSGSVDIGVNAADNDQVALVGLFVNRQLKLMKSDPPFKYTLDTTTLPLLNGRGTLTLEAWAYDRAQNRGVAKPITVYVNNPINATPLQPDPKGGTGRRGDGGTGRPASGSTPSSPRPPVSPSPRPAVTPAPRLSPLEALLAPLAGAGAVASPGVKSSEPARPPAAQAAPEPETAAVPAPPLTAKPSHQLETALSPQPSPGVKQAAPPSSRPSQSDGAAKPHPVPARLEVALSGAPALPPTADGPRRLAPERQPSRAPSRPVLKPAPVQFARSRTARIRDGELIAVPRLPKVTAPLRSRPAARPKPSLTLALRPAESLPKPLAIHSKPVASPAGARTHAPPAAPSHPRPERAATPERIELPVYRLARLPESLSHDHTYTVRHGDTLNSIAKQHGVTPRSILVASGLQNAAEIAPGSRLTIPGTFTIAYNDQPVGFDVQPRVERGMAITPFRQLFEHTGGEVRYQPAGREVLAINPDKQVRLKIGSREALVNSVVVVMDRAAFLDSGRTMVPVKFMTEALDLKAEYDVKTGAIYLIHK